MSGQIAAVTGASGHLGANLVRALLDTGDLVRVVTAEPVTQELPALGGLPVTRVQADVTDPRQVHVALEGADVVYHLAGYVSVVRRDADRMWHVNRFGTQTVADAALAVGVRRVVHVSSVQTLAPAEVLHEGCPPADAGATAYDRSKLAGERAVLQRVDRGLDAVVVLPTAMLGPHDYAPSRAGRSLLSIWQGRMPAVTEGGHDWVDVRDVAAGMLAAARHGTAGRRYLLGGSWCSLSDLARRAATLAGRRGPRLQVPLPVARALAPVAERAALALGVEPWFTPDALHALAHHRHVEHQLAASELGYQPRPVDRTLADTYAWFATRAANPATDPRRQPARTAA